MSNFADKTDKRVLTLCCRAIKELDTASYLDMTKSDDWKFTEARNDLAGIIQTNGYKIAYPSYRLRKVK